MKNHHQLLLIAFVAITNALHSQNYHWAKHLSSNDAFSTGIVVLDIANDQAGNIIIGGYFSGTVDFNHGSGVANLSASGMDYDIFIAKYDKNGNYVWANSIGSNQSDACKSIAIDTAGNIYIAGMFGGTADFDPGVGVKTLIFSGDYDMFIAKYDGNGNYVWANAMNGSSGEEAYSIGLDLSGNVYVAGDFQSTVDFDPGVGVKTYTAVGGTNAYNMFFGKYDNNGNYIWVHRLETPSQSRLAVDQSGNFYLTGTYTGNIDFDLGSGTTILPATGNIESYIAKYNTNGNLIFAYGFESTKSETAMGIDLDASGSMYVCGIFGGQVDFDPGPGVANLTAPSMFSASMFIAKYDASGNYVWAKSLPVELDLSPKSRILRVDKNSDIFICGQLGFSADFDPGPGTANINCTGGTCIYLAKYDNSGNYLFAFGIGNMVYDSKATSATVNSSGDIIICGNFGSTNDFDPGTGVDTLTAVSANKSDIFIASYSSGPVAVDAVNYTSNIKVFPNPVSENIFVKTAMGGQLDIILYDVSSKILLSQSFVNQTQINTSHLAEGIYFYEVKNKNGIVEKGKIVKQ